jgi:hypothetical protein
VRIAEVVDRQGNRARTMPRCPRTSPGSMPRSRSSSNRATPPSRQQRQRNARPRPSSSVGSRS